MMDKYFSKTLTQNKETPNQFSPFTLNVQNLKKHS